MISLAILFIGFSIFSALSLVFTHFCREHYRGHDQARLMGLVLLFVLFLIQLAHFFWLYLDQEWVSTLSYRLALFTVAPAFYLFSLPLLKPRDTIGFKFVNIVHILPILLSPLLANDLALPVAFILGSGYLLWLANSLYLLRRQRESFRLEMVLLSSVFAIAIGASVLGLFQAALPNKLFFSLYSIAIGLAFFIVQLTLAIRPSLSTEVSETALSAYSSSTLKHIDCDSVLLKLEVLMTEECLYHRSDLNMTVLAQHLDLTNHQLSELINTKLGKSFSRYLRELRINAAKALLCEEPSSSILSIGLSVGFTSQSNFYGAFREIEGMTPGKFRKLNIKN